MCYEFSNWFLKARAKEIHKARETPGPVRSAPVDASASQSEAPRPQTTEPEKVPA